MDTITVVTQQGVQFLLPLLPMVWNGHRDCFVGPFSSKDVACYYAENVVAFKSLQAYQVLAKRDDWYVQVGDVQTPMKRLPAKVIG